LERGAACILAGGCGPLLALNLIIETTSSDLRSPAYQARYVLKAPLISKSCRRKSLGDAVQLKAADARSAYLRLRS
jgi:hypothetical protein